VTNKRIDFIAQQYRTLAIVSTPTVFARLTQQPESANGKAAGAAVGPQLAATMAGRWRFQV
ncbi:MAG: hypothetical protein WCJ07_13505, partial [Verrucomicrobiota bacterium]